jgi:hypothetical protein
MDADAPAASPASTNRLLDRLPVWGAVNRGDYGAIPENQETPAASQQRRR